MSTFTQFFPTGGSSGGSSGGGAGNIGGGTTPVEIIGMSGGGGSGGNSPYPGCGTVCGVGGEGGMGAIFYANNYFITPGTTYPITIGAGGAAGTPATGTATQGTNGGATSFNNPECLLCVCGGGGGGAATNCAPRCACTYGRDGGTGGAGGNAKINGGPGCATPGCQTYIGCGGKGSYYDSQLSICKAASYTAYTLGPIGICYYCRGVNTVTSRAATLKQPWGFMGGFDSDPEGAQNYGPLVVGGTCYLCTKAGGAMSNVTTHRVNCLGQAPSQVIVIQCCQTRTVGDEDRCFDLNWFSDGRLCLGSQCSYIASGGLGDGSNTGGCPGVLFIRYPDEYAAATVVNGTDCSPVTPGYRSYRFSTSGSITL